MTDLEKRASNAMIGLAVGNAVSWTSMFHRSYTLPQWTRRIRREMDVAAETENLLLTPMPFSLNQPPEYFNLSVTWNTEWAAFSAKNLMNSNTENYEQKLLDEWIKLSAEQVRGSVAIIAALKNFSKGLIPPETGIENPHYFDDSSFTRAVPIGIFCAGDNDRASYYAGIDAEVTNHEDGVWAAKSIAVAVSTACSGGDINTILNNCLSQLPEESWVRRVTEEALVLSKASNTIFSIFPELHNHIVNKEYSYGNTAPETLALALAIIQLHGYDFEKSVEAACLFTKNGETLPSIVGALCGAINPLYIIGNYWKDSVKILKGISIPSLHGIDYINLVNQISKLAGSYI